MINKSGKVFRETKRKIYLFSISEEIIRIISVWFVFDDRDLNLIF